MKKKKKDDTKVKDIRNLFRLKKETKANKKIIIRDIRNLSEHEEEVCCKPVRVGKFWSNNHTEYESNGNINKTLSVEEYPNKIRPFLEGIINNLKKFDTWKIQLVITIYFVSSKNDDKVRVMYTKSDNRKIMINNKAVEVPKKLFQLPLNIY